MTVKLCDRDIIVPLRKTLLVLVQRGEGRESSNFRWRARQGAGRDIDAQALTGSLAGIFAEPAAATSVAAARKLGAAGVIGRDDIVVCNLTGHGLKQPEAVRISEEELHPIAPTIESLRERIRSLENLLNG